MERPSDVGLLEDFEAVEDEMAMMSDLEVLGEALLAAKREASTDLLLELIKEVLSELSGLSQRVAIMEAGAKPAYTPNTPYQPYINPYPTVNPGYPSPSYPVTYGTRTSAGSISGISRSEYLMNAIDMALDEDTFSGLDDDYDDSPTV